MDGATSELKTVLEGKFVNILPYARGYYPRHTLFQIWQDIENEGMGHRLFWEEGESGDPTPHPLSGDPTQFIQQLTKPHTEILFGYDKATTELVGLFWFSDVMVGHQAFTNIWVKKQYYGQPSRDFSRLCLQYAFVVWDMMQLWVATPWQEAMALSKEMGFVEAGCLNRYCQVKGEWKDVSLLQLTKDAWEQGYGRFR